jgi:RadC-like JAB domain
MESRMRRKAHVRFGERGGRNRRAYPRYGAPAPTLRDPTPSLEDVAFTRRLVVACEAVGVKLIDHLILGSTHRWISLRDRGVW